MRYRWINPLTVLLLFLLIVAAVSAAWTWGGGWGDGHHTEIARIVNPDGTATGGTVVIESNRDGHIFPFGILFFPLVFFGFFFLVRGLFWRGPGRGPWGPGPGGPGGPGWRSRPYDDETPPAWFRAWEHHQREQRGETPPAPKQGEERSDPETRSS